MIFDDVLIIKNGRNQKAVENPKGKYPIYGSGGVMGYADDYICSANTVVIGRKGSINNPIFVECPFWNVDTAFGLEAKTEVLIPRYLYYFCKHFNFEKLNKTVTIPSLTKSDLLKIEIDLPEISKQQSIVSQLSKIEDVVALRQRQLQKLDELVKARFVELFGGKGYPEDTLLNLCNIIDYRGKTPEKVEYGLPFITAKNVKMHQMNLEPREYISKETYDKVMVRGFPKEGDVVFTTEAPLGNVCRIPHFDTEFYIGQRIVTMQTEKLEPIYLEYALSSDDFKMKYMGKSSGSTVTGIRVRLLEQLTIPVPPIDIQTQFATFVEQIDKSKVVVQKALDEAQTLFDSLMQEYFR